MQIISRTQRATEAAKRWKEQYTLADGSWSHAGLKPADEVYRKIVGTSDPDYIDRVIGNDTWTSVRCHECEQYFEQAIQIGQEPDYESNTATVCLDCLKRAVSALEQLTPQKV